MLRLREKFLKKLDKTPTDFVRSTINKLESRHRLVGLKGARGVGKTTLLLQYIKLHLTQVEKVLYVSLDDLYFSDNKLYDLTDTFVKDGGKHLFIDEIHTYSSWSRELKMIYDDFPELQVRFTGSSILHLNNGISDLSRRAVIHHIKGLSFREFLNLEYGLEHEPLSLEIMLSNHVDISRKVVREIKPLQAFKNYLQWGYFPFYREGIEDYHQKIQQVIQLILEHDIPAQEELQYSSMLKLKRLLYVVAQSVPFKPNMVKLSEQVELTRNSATQFLHLLEEANLLNLLMAQGKGNSIMQKPDKIYLYHPNLMYAIAPEKIDMGNLRESFFLNQLRPNYQLNEAKSGDFLVNDSYTFEIGEKNKTNKQIETIENSYLALDEIEIGYKQTIPLWLFGLVE